MSARASRRLVALAAMLAVVLVSATAPAAPPPRPEFTVPRAEKPPVIDGKVQPAEWAGALAFTGTLDGGGKLSAVPTTFYLTYDDQRLYWAASSILPGGRRPSGGWGNENTWFKFAEGFWLHVFPNIDGPAGSRAWYWLIVNCDGVKLDTRFGVDGGRVQEMWEGHWQIRNHVEDGLWQIEVSAPVSDFSPKPIADGDVWGMNLAFRWHEPYQLAIVSPDEEIGESANYERFCRMRFDSSAPALQIAALGDVARGELSLQGSAHRSGRAAQEIQLQLTLSAPGKAGEGPAELWRQDRTLALDKPAVELAWKEKLPIADKNNVLRILARAAGGKTVLMDRTVYFDRLGPQVAAPAKAAKEKPAAALSLTGAYLPGPKHLRVSLDFSQFAELQPVPASAAFSVAPAQQPEQPVKTVSMKLDPASLRKPEAPQAKQDLSGPAPGELVLDLADAAHRQAGEELPYGTAVTRLELGRPADGIYLVTATLQDAQGRAIASTQGKFMVASRPWEANTLGVSNEVIEPWTPMEAGDGKVACWGRQHELNSGGLFAQVWAAGVARPQTAGNLLASDIRFVVRAAGKDQVLTAAAEAPVRPTVSATRDRASWEGSLAGGPVRIDVKANMEYDGLALYELTLVPAGKQAIEELRLEVPLRDEAVRLMHVASDGRRQHAESDFVPAGRGVVWDSLSNFRNAVIKGTFVPYVWLGNEDRGLCYFATSDQGWVLRDDKAAVDMVRGDDAFTLRLHLVNRPVMLAGPRKIVLGFQATPVKPWPDGWRNWQFAWGGGPAEGVRIHVHGSSHPWASGLASQLAADWDQFQEKWCSDFKDGKGRRFLPYLSITTTARGMPDYQAYKGEWDPARLLPLVTEPGREVANDWAGTNPWNYDEIACLVTPSNIDFRMWALDEMLKRGVQGIYEDNVKLTAVYKPEAGFGYVREDGTEQPTNNLLLLREYHKRQAVLFAKYGRAHPHTVIHMTRKLVAPVMSFTDISYDGEWRNVYCPEVDFVHLWDLGTIRSEGLGRQYGLVPTWHVMIRGRNRELPELTRSTLSVLGPNDIMLLGGYHNNDERAKYQKVVDDFGTGGNDCVFFPYWQASPAVRCSQGAIASAYRRDSGKVLLVVANRAEQPQDVRMELDAKALALPPGEIAAVDAQTQETFNLKDNVLVVPVGRHDYRQLLLVKR